MHARGRQILTLTLALALSLTPTRCADHPRTIGSGRSASCRRAPTLSPTVALAPVSPSRSRGRGRSRGRSCSPDPNPNPSQACTTGRRPASTSARHAGPSAPTGRRARASRGPGGCRVCLSYARARPAPTVQETGQNTGPNTSVSSAGLLRLCVRARRVPGWACDCEGSPTARGDDALVVRLTVH